MARVTAMLHGYADLLDRFDRKERGWLIRQCAGARGQLSGELLQALQATFGGPPPPADSWWTIDYHLDWLAGASRWDPDQPHAIHVGGAVKGSVEDIDLIIAAPDRLYLIEAKATQAWNNRQLTSKARRIGEICSGGWLSLASLGASIPVSFGLLSIGAPAKVSTERWPTWMLAAKGRPFALDLKAPIRGDHLIVQRTERTGKDDVVRWSVVQSKT